MRIKTEIKNTNFFLLKGEIKKKNWFNIMQKKKKSKEWEPNWKKQHSKLGLNDEIENKSKFYKKIKNKN